MESGPEMDRFFASYSLFTGRPSLRTLGKRFEKKLDATFAELLTI